MTTEPTEPYEPDDGQETEPPSPGMAVLVAIFLLRDLRDYLEGHDLRGSLREALRREDPRDDLLLRIAAVVAVLHRVREELADGRDR